MGKTSIEWTDRTWNPTRGCSRVSPGCVNCYAERVAVRFVEGPIGSRDSDHPHYGPFHGFATRVNGHPAWTGKVELIEHKLLEPLRWKKPQRIFVNSMSDLFHEALPDRSISRVFAVIAQANWHTYQILTKRAERMRDYMTKHPHNAFPWVWLGVSVEDRQRKNRIELLRQTPAALRFLSVEPLLEDIGELNLDGIGWVIVGGESGPGARSFDIARARDVRDQCRAAGVAFFMKQFGAHPFLERDAEGAFCPDYEYRLKDRKGGDWDEWPKDSRVREFPA